MKRTEQSPQLQAWYNKVEERYRADPKDPHVLVQMGALAICSGKQAEATDYLTAAKASPDHSPHFTIRILCIQAQMAAREGNIEAAQRLLHEARGIHGDNTSGAIILHATQKELGIAERLANV